MAPSKVIFFLSTGRTGTKALAEGLEGNGIVSVHQPPYSRILTIASNYYLHGWLPRFALVKLTEWIRLKQIDSANGHTYVQVFALDHLAAKIVTEKRPDTLIVHMIRDPRTFVPSYINWSHTRFKSFVANKFVVGWHPSGYFTGKLSWQAWQEMNELQRVCWHWVYKNQMLASLFADYPGYKCIRFEDLFLGNESHNILRELLDFLGIRFEERFAVIYQQEKNTSRKSFFPRWVQWTSKQQEQLFDICGPLMQHYGYGLQ